MRKYSLALFILALIISIALGEALVYTFNLDLMQTKSILYYQRADAAVHIALDNHERLFGLRPNSSMKDGYVNPDETRYKEKTVTINSLGFRDKERTQAKPDGVFRILVFGGSNTYGALVSDNDTYPMQMQSILDSRYPGRFEVWNAGVSAYVMTQKLSYAREAIEKYDPDLIIIQHFNVGRRAFLPGGVNYSFFRENPDLYLENIPSPSDSEWALKLHRTLVRYSATYRLYASVYAKIRLVYIESHKGFAGQVFSACDRYAESLNEAAQDRFLSEKDRPPVVMMNLIFNKMDEPSSHPDFYYFTLNVSDLPPEYSDIHPPSYVYAYYADTLISYLERNRLLPG